MKNCIYMNFVIKVRYVIKFQLLNDYFFCYWQLIAKFRTFPLKSLLQYKLYCEGLIKQINN